MSFIYYYLGLGTFTRAALAAPVGWYFPGSMVEIANCNNHANFYIFVEINEAKSLQKLLMDTSTIIISVYSKKGWHYKFQGMTLQRVNCNDIILNEKSFAYVMSSNFNKVEFRKILGNVFKILRNVAWTGGGLWKYNKN